MCKQCQIESWILNQLWFENQVLWFGYGFRSTAGLVWEMWVSTPWLEQCWKIKFITVLAQLWKMTKATSTIMLGVWSSPKQKALRYIESNIESNEVYWEHPFKYWFSVLKELYFYSCESILFCHIIALGHLRMYLQNHLHIFQQCIK